MLLLIMLQMWDLSTALDLTSKGEDVRIPDTGGPSPCELMEQLDLCDLTNSCANTPSISPSPSLLNALYPLPQRGATPPTISTPERLRRTTSDGPSVIKPKVTQF